MFSRNQKEPNENIYRSETNKTEVDMLIVINSLLNKVRRGMKAYSESP